MAKKSMKKRGSKGGCDWKAGKRHSRKIRGGAYGAGAPITAGALEYKAAYTGAADPKTGAAVPDPALIGTPSEGGYTGMGGRRSRRKTAKKGRKGGKGKKTRKHRMRGGASQISAMKAGYGFDGSGEAGLANAVPAPTSGGNAF